MNRIKKIILSPWFSLATLALIIALRVADPSFVESVRLRAYDTLITSQPVVQSDNVVIANIDEAAIRNAGQWPFPRYVNANIIEQLYQHGAGLVVWNTIMSEPDRFDGDQSLSETIKKYPVVLSKIPLDKPAAPFAAALVARLDEPDPIPVCDNPLPGVSVIGDDINNWVVKYPVILSNLDIFETCAAGSGVTNTLPEIDGVTRRLPMVIGSGDRLYPNLALETLRVVAGDPSFQVKVGESGIQAVRIPQFKTITTDSIGRIWLSWNTKFSEFSVTDIPQLDGKIVIVGLTANGLSNSVPTSAGSKYPHYLQGSVIDTLTNGDAISVPDWSFIAEIGLTIILAIISISLTRWKYGFIPVIIFVSGIYFFVNYIFTANKILLDCTFPILGIICVYLHSYTVKFISELNQKLQIKKQFGGYVSPVMVERLQKNPELIRLGGERKELSVVMSDMRNFTRLGESYGDMVEEFTSTMNSYMTYISEPILEHDGCLIKFIGDASLHVHGAPLEDVNHAVSAVKAGLGMIEAVEKFNIELQSQGKPPVGMGVGVNTGETLIGNIGSKTRFGYDVLGDTVSLTSRLEGQTKGYGVLIIIGEKTADLVQDEFPLAELDCIAVKGKSIGVKMYTIANPLPEHQLYLEAYYAGDWESAAIICKYLSEQPGDLQNYYELMLERISGECPSDWSGVWKATSK